MRSRCNSPALALATMPWKQPPGEVWKCSASLVETIASATAASSRPIARQASPHSVRIKAWFVVVLVEPVFRPLGDGIHYSYRISKRSRAAPCRRSRLFTPVSISSGRSTSLSARTRAAVSWASVIHSSPSKPYSCAVSRIWVMAFLAIVARSPQSPHDGALRPPLLRQTQEFGMACGERRQIDAVGLDDMPGLLVPTARALPFGLSFIVTRPSSIRRRLISLTRVGERPRASCCVEAEGPNDRRNSS